jgi:hypothetical protein
MERTEISEIYVRRLIERIVSKPKHYVSFLGTERIERLWKFHLERQLSETKPVRRVAYLGAGLVYSNRFNEKLEGFKDRGVYRSPKGEQITISQLDDRIIRELTHAVGLIGLEKLDVEELNTLARQHIAMILIDRDNIEVIRKPTTGQPDGL